MEEKSKQTVSCQSQLRGDEQNTMYTVGIGLPAPVYPSTSIPTRESADQHKQLQFRSVTNLVPSFRTSRQQYKPPTGFQQSDKPHNFLFQYGRHC